MAETKSDARKASHSKSADSPTAEKRYPIIHTIVLGKGEPRSKGVVTASEVGGEDAIEQMLKLGVISDPDAPVRPSEASDAKARTLLTDAALASGLITRDGDRYSFVGKSLTAAELQMIPLAELSAGFAMLRGET